MMTFSFTVTPSRCMEVLSELFEVQLYLELQVKFLFYTSMLLSVFVFEVEGKWVLPVTKCRKSNGDEILPEQCTTSQRIREI